MANRYSLLWSRSVFWEALEKSETACPFPVTLVLCWGAASCVHYPPKFKVLPRFFSTRGQVHTLRPCLMNWPVPWRTTSFQQKLPEPKSKPAYVPPPKTQNTKVSTLSPQSALHPGTGMLFWKNMPDRLCSLRPASSQRWDAWFRNRSLNLIDTPSCQPLLVLAFLCGFCHKCKLKWRWACSQHYSFFLLFLLIWTRLIILMLAQMRKKCKVHMRLWKSPQVSQLSKILVLCGRHSLNSLLAKNLSVFLWEFQFTGVWKGSTFDMFLLKSNCHSHRGTRSWPCVWKVHYIFSRLVCKRKITFFRSHKPKKKKKSFLKNFYTDQSYLYFTK